MLRIVEDAGWDDAPSVREVILDEVKRGELHVRYERWPQLFDSLEEVDRHELLPDLARAVLDYRDFDFLSSDYGREYSHFLSWNQLPRQELVEFLDALAELVTQSMTEEPIPYGHVRADLSNTLTEWLDTLGELAYPDPFERLQWFCQKICDAPDVFFPDDERTALTEEILSWFPTRMTLDEARAWLGLFDGCAWHSVLDEEYVQHVLDTVRAAFPSLESDPPEDPPLEALRPHQRRAVEAVLARVSVEGPAEERGGVVHHAMGSGVYETMSTLVRAYREQTDDNIIILAHRADDAAAIEAALREAGLEYTRPRDAGTLELDTLFSGNTSVATVSLLSSLHGRTLPWSSRTLVLLVNAEHGPGAGGIDAIVAAFPDAARLAFVGTLDDRARQRLSAAFGPVLDQHLGDAPGEGGRTVHLARCQPTTGNDSVPSEDPTSSDPTRFLEWIARSIAEDWHAHPERRRGTVVCKDRQAVMALRRLLMDANIGLVGVSISAGPNDPPEWAESHDRQRRADVVRHGRDGNGERMLLVVARDIPTATAVPLDAAYLAHRVSAATTSALLGALRRPGHVDDPKLLDFADNLRTNLWQHGASVFG
jgi:hypothetical protein